MKKKTSISFKSLVKYGLQGVALGLVAMTVVLFLTIDPETFRRLKDIPVFFFFVLLGMVCCAWLCHGARIRLLSGSMGYRLSYARALAIALSVEFGVAASPAGMGGAVVRLAFLKRAGVPYTRAASMLTADVMLDFMYFTGLVIATAVVVFLDPVWRSIISGFQSTAPGRVVIVIFVVSLLFALIFLFSGKWAREFERFLGRLQFAKRRRLPARLRLGRARFELSVKRTMKLVVFLFRRRKAALLGSFAFAALQWSCRYGVLPLAVLAFSPDKNPFPLMAVQGLLFAFGLLVVVPGGGGGVELLSAVILQYFIPGSLVGIVVLVWRFFTFHLYLAVGGVAFFFTCGKKTDDVIRRPPEADVR
jgi:uncharacterized protein (TIRG00374 family)